MKRAAACKRTKNSVLRSAVRNVLLTTAAVTLTACTMGRSYAPPEIPKLKPDVLQERDTERFGPAEPVKDWWNALQDKQLTALVERALLHNLDVKIAIARMEEARAIADRAELGHYPQVTAGAYAERKKHSKESGPTTGAARDTYQAGFDATWEADIFGQVSGRIDEQNARYESREANLQGAYVTVAAEVARNYIELRGGQQRMEIARRAVANRQKNLELAQQLQTSGHSNDIDLDQAQIELGQAQAKLPPIEAQVNASINRLGILTGQTPDALRSELKEVKSLPRIPSNVPVGDAGTLLKRRPDIRAAERNLAASVADYNVNVADLYPRITIDGSIGFLATTLGNLFTGGAMTALVQPTLYWSAFNRETVKTKIDAADARTREQVANFEKTVLSALEEVDTSMVNFSREQERRNRLVHVVAANAHAHELAQKRFDKGMDSLPEMLASESKFLTVQDQLVACETQGEIYLIALYKALGGGWEVASATAAK